MMQRDIQLPDNRKFGYFFAAVFLFVGWYFEFPHLLQFCLMTIGILFFLCAALKPDILQPLNRVWMQFGLLLGRIISPLVMGFIFFLLLTPIAVITRFLGRDVLKLKMQKGQSHWIDREPKGPDGDSFKNQF